MRARPRRIHGPCCRPSPRQFPKCVVRHDRTRPEITYLTAHNDDRARRSNRDSLIRRLQGIHCLVVPHRFDLSLARLLEVDDEQRPIRRARERCRLAAEGERRLSVPFNPIQFDFLKTWNSVSPFVMYADETVKKRTYVNPAAKSTSLSLSSNPAEYTCPPTPAVMPEMRFVWPSPWILTEPPTSADAVSYRNARPSAVPTKKVPLPDCPIVPEVTDL